MQYVGWFADIVGILGACFALMAWLQARQVRKSLEQEQQRQNRKITVVLQHGGKKLELPVELRRTELTRAEVLGRLGMIPTKEKGRRFALNYLATSEFFRQVNQIAMDSGDDLLTIPCNAEEFEQFDLSKL